MFGIMKFIFWATLIVFALPPFVAFIVPILAVTLIVSILVGCGWFLFTIFTFIIE